MLISSTVIRFIFCSFFIMCISIMNSVHAVVDNIHDPLYTQNRDTSNSNISKNSRFAAYLNSLPPDEYESLARALKSGISSLREVKSTQSLSSSESDDDSSIQDSNNSICTESNDCYDSVYTPTEPDNDFDDMLSIIDDDFDTSDDDAGVEEPGINSSVYSNDSRYDNNEEYVKDKLVLQTQNTDFLLPPPSPSLPQSGHQVNEEAVSNQDIELPPPPSPDELLVKPDADTNTDSTRSAYNKGRSDTLLLISPPPPPPLKNKTTAENDKYYDNRQEKNTEPNLGNSNNVSLGLQQNPMIADTVDHAHSKATQATVMHHTLLTSRIIKNSISRKISSNNGYSQLMPQGASESSSVSKYYDFECKYLYSFTRLPKKYTTIHTQGILMNLKYNISNKLTFGIFYAPNMSYYKIQNRNNNSNINTTVASRIINHCIGMYTSYAITPATHISSQVLAGITTTDVKKNNSGSTTYPHYFTIDSFVSHKFTLGSKTISPLIGLSYYNSESRLDYDSKVSNLSLILGSKFQYIYRRKDLEFIPSIKLAHIYSIYSNDNMMSLKDNIPQDALRDFHTPFNSSSSITLALAVRRRSMRFEVGYECAIDHGCDDNITYIHILNARINIFF